MAWGGWEAVIREFQQSLENAQQVEASMPRPSWQKVGWQEYNLHMFELAQSLKAHPVIGQTIPGTRLGSIVLWHGHLPNKQLNIMYTDEKIYTIFIYTIYEEKSSEMQDVAQENLIPVIIAYLEKLASSQ